MHGRGVLLLAAAMFLPACAQAPPPIRSAGPPLPPATSQAVASAYGAEPEVALSPQESVALDLARARLGTSRSVPRVSSALVLAARELAERASLGSADPLARPSVRGALARAGAFDPAPAAALVAAPAGTAAGSVARALTPGRATHVGAAIVERDGLETIVVLASERRARLSSFPREVAPGRTAVLSGSLEPGLRRPRVFVTRPSGLVDEIPVAGPRGFRADVPFRAPGRHVVELTAEGDGGPEVVALLVVASGAVSLDRPGVPLPTVEPEEEAAAEAAVVRAINATRGRHGLAPLEGAAAVAAVARAHSEEMAKAGKVAHVLPRSSDVGERLRRAGIAYRRVYENVARAAASLAAHEAAEESPAHLANLLRPEVSLVGVGIARASSPSGASSTYLTEVFVEPADDGSRSALTAEGRVREALWRERARLHLPPLTADAVLDLLARESARSMLDRDATDAPDLGPRSLALGRRLAAVDVFVASAPEDVVRSANLVDRRFARVGVGVVVGESRRFGAGRYFIAVVYTD